MYPVQQFLTDIIRPALGAINLYSENAEQLLLGTALQESLLTYTRQIGGPALGYFQMEPFTHDDLWLNFLKYKRDLAQLVVNVAGQSPDASLLETNHAYAVAMCRVHYLRAPAKLPAFGDVTGMANYWKKYYNTHLGKGKPEEFLDKWDKFVVPSGVYS